MTSARSTKKSGSSAPGAKLLITAASLAATLGGWALLSTKEEAQPAAIPTLDQIVAPAVTIKLAPLPTLVPPITPQPQTITIKQSHPAVSAPPAAPNEIVLRDVSAPALPSRSAPEPVANTRTSR